MKLAVSSLAWEPADDIAVRALLVEWAVRAIELAPLKYWPSALDASASALAEYRAAWADAGISIVALQGILFGKPDLQLFGSEVQRRALEEHLAGIAQVAEGLGASVVVLGAPGNRLRGSLTEDEAIESAIPVLRRLAAQYDSRGCALCIEAAPPAYGGDFARNLAEVSRLVEAVGHRGFGLHLDSGAIAIADEPQAEVVRAARQARHFHVSEMDLAAVGTTDSVPHGQLGATLRALGYEGWLSIEMRGSDDDRWHDQLQRAIAVARTHYGD